MKFFELKQDVINPLSQEVLIRKGSVVSSAMIEFMHDVFGFDSLEVVML